MWHREIDVCNDRKIESLFRVGADCGSVILVREKEGRERETMIPLSGHAQKKNSRRHFEQRTHTNSTGLHKS